MPTLTQELHRLISPLPLHEIRGVLSSCPGCLDTLSDDIGVLEAALRDQVAGGGGGGGGTVVVPSASLDVLPFGYPCISGIYGRVRPEFDGVVDMGEEVDSGLSPVMYEFDRGVLAASMDTLKVMEDGVKTLKDKGG